MAERVFDIVKIAVHPIKRTKALLRKSLLIFHILLNEVVFLPTKLCATATDAINKLREALKVSFDNVPLNLYIWEFS